MESSKNIRSKSAIKSYNRARAGSGKRSSATKRSPRRTPDKIPF